MNSMNVFSSTINDSFGYEEIEWKNNKYLVDFNSNESVTKFLTIITGEQTLTSCLSSLAKFNDAPDFLNKLIELIPGSVLADTQYSKYHENIGNGNWVLFRKDLFKEKKKNNSFCIGYIGEGTSLDNPEQPINMSAMYSMCSDRTLEHADLTEWDVSNVVDLSSVFAYCDSLEDVNLSTWNVENATEMSHMFDGCRNLKSIDLTTWNVQSLMYANGMFFDCVSLENVKLNNWNTQALKAADWMFCNCKKLQQLDLHSWDTRSLVDISSMFFGCRKLHKLNVSGWNTENLHEVANAFSECNELYSLDLSSWHPKILGSTEKIFKDCDLLKTTHNDKFDKILEETRCQK